LLLLLLFLLLLKLWLLLIKGLAPLELLLKELRLSLALDCGSIDVLKVRMLLKLRLHLLQNLTLQKWCSSTNHVLWLLELQHRGRHLRWVLERSCGHCLVNVRL
jgi:hypothetical protein